MPARSRRSRASRPGHPDAFWELVATARHLQAPGGCPWDRAQTVHSLLPHLVEEVWEAFCAAKQSRRQALEEELGDVLYTVIFLTLLAERQGWFTLRSLLGRTRSKMVRRHPHVFGTQRAHSPQEAYDAWQAVKRREQRGKRPTPRLRPLLVEVWEALRRNPGAPAALQQALTRLPRPKPRL